MERHGLPDRGTYYTKKVPRKFRRIKKVLCVWQADRVEENGMRTHDKAGERIREARPCSNLKNC